MLSLKPAVTTELLRRVSVFTHLPETKLQWMINQGKAVKVPSGGLLRAEGDPANCVFVLLEGTCRMTQRSGNQDILLVQHDCPTLIGEVPLLMGVPQFWASGRAVTTCHVLELSADTFWQFMGLCPTVARSVLQTMVARMQEVQVMAQHRERLISLGTLAAGLAHELNNPASAAQRAARELRKVFPVMQTQTLRITHHCLTDDQREFLTNLQQDAIARAQNPPLLNPMEQSDREDQLADWIDSHIDSHNLQNGWQFASTFVNAGLDCDWLDQIPAHLNQTCLQDALTWLDATLNVVWLLNTLGHSTGRIYQLVGAVQDYSALDPDDLQPADIHKGLESTLTILGHKLKRGVTVIRDYADDLPSVMSHGAELEQVWMNVIDNAIAATLERFDNSASITSTPSLHTNPLMIPTGWQNRVRHLSTVNQPTIWIQTRCEADWILVEIADNGIGIPPEVQPHIYEPFFTTKGVGKGTGLGLNTSYKIVKQHGGDIRVFSQPGDTCFKIRFPSQC